MNADYSNTSMLDMVFEHRNKAYGAYVLRRDYNKSLQQAILSILSVVTLFCFGNFIKDKIHNTKTEDTGHSTICDLHQVITHPTVVPPKPKVDPPKPQHAQAIATAANTEKHVVTNDKAPDDSIPATRDIADLESGLKTNTDAPTGGIGATDGEGTDRVFEVAKEVVPAPSQVFTFVEIMPQFPGGDQALLNFISRNVEYPQMERDNGIEGKVITAFTVNEDGSITDVEILRSPSPGFNREVNRMMKKMPAFKPGMQQGRAVKVRFNLPVAFKLR